MEKSAPEDGLVIRGKTGRSRRAFALRAERRRSAAAADSKHKSAFRINSRLILSGLMR
jgi:hypothetical protein